MFFSLKAPLIPIRMLRRPLIRRTLLIKKAKEYRKVLINLKKRNRISLL